MTHDLWHQLTQSAGVPLGEAQVADLERYLDLLEAGNARMNLTRIVDREHARVQHIADALTLLPHLPAGPATLADVGSGGGVPGIPLAIARPDLHVTLIESIGKKAAFLQETAEALNLPNLHVWRGRAEAWEGPRFDLITCRAVGNLSKLLTWCLPILRPDGILLAMKGPKLAEEQEEAADLLRARRLRLAVHPVEAPELTGHLIAEVRRENDRN